ncbi:MAG: two-component regulator propeller domain-containing protein [Lutibacter sp.]|nr:two-component regulator propeller domain-containing protein [Lutibacter sp.]
MRKIGCFFIVFLLFQSTLRAQIPGLTQFTTNNGLPSNTIYDIVQDEDGFIWFATDYGISKFDGLTFKNFTINDGIPDNEILLLFKDTKNRIWMFGFNGNIGFIQNEKIFNINNVPFLNDLNFTNFISETFEDSKKNIWFFESLSNIKKLDSSNRISSFNLEKLFLKNGSKKFKITETTEGDLKILVSITNQQNINQIFSTSISKPKWELINLDLYDQGTILSLRKEKPEAFKNIDNVSLQISDIIFNSFNYTNSSNLLYQTLFYNNSYLVTNLNDGVILINSNNKFQNKKILPSIRSTKSFLDDENNIWIGSQSNGIFLLPNLGVKGIQFDNLKKNDLNAISIFQDKLVLGNEQSEIIILNKETFQTIFEHKLDKNPRRIRQLKSHNNILYIMGDNSIYRLNANFKIERIKNMFDADFLKTDLKNFKYFSTEDDEIYTANSNGVGKINSTSSFTEKLWNQRSASIYYAGNDSLWIGTTKGLYLQNKGVTKKYDLGNQFNANTIYALENTSKGLLIGSNAYGLGILKNGKFKSISITNGLLSNYVKSIFVDKKNNIWLSTNLGLNRLTLDNSNNLVHLKTYTISDGLYSNDVRACYVDENKVYVATSNGLNIIDISKEENSMLAPRIHINDILLNNNIIEKTNNQTFDYKSNNIQFNFSGISFKSLGNITFKYRLLGLEPDWIETKNNTVRYAELPPNNYTFEVKAISKNNLESINPSIFSFQVKPPIYKTWWFISIAILMLILFIAYLFYRRNQKIKQQEKIKENISNLRFKALNAQMNPHFINNLLVNIEDLANKGDIEEVKNCLGKFGELVNLILQSTKSNLINLTDEIEMAKLYLELQKLRFHKNTSYTIDTESISPEELENILVPPMILQPIIENAFKHGFRNGDKTNCICIDFKIENDEFLICEIIDNGVGIQKNENSVTSSSSGISFSNINERLQLINVTKSEENLVIISNVTDEFNTLVGLKVTLKIPLISF